jgi:hypothetical protein
MDMNENIRLDDKALLGRFEFRVDIVILSPFLFRCILSNLIAIWKDI